MILLMVFLIAYFCMLFFVPYFKNNWFAFSILFMSVFLLVKAYFFRSDSSLFYSILLWQVSIIFFNNLNKSLTIFQIGSLINTMVAFAFFIDYLVFLSKFTLYSFLTNFSISLPVLLYSFNCINLVLMILFVCGALLLSIAIIFNKNEKIQSS